MKNKNILFSIDEISGYKESVEKVLRLKFKNITNIISDYPDRSQRSLSFKIIRELNRYIKCKKLRTYNKNYISNFQDEKINSLPFNYDYFFACAGRSFSKGFIEKLKHKNKNIKCILFLWDKLEYFNSEFDYSEFDYIFTFDPDDASKFNLLFRPSFFIDECKEKELSWNKKEISLLYVGVLRDVERYNLIDNIYNNHLSDEQRESSFLKLFLAKQYQGNLPNEFNSKLITYEKIDYIDLMDKMIKSKVVLDIPHKNQKGLTLRTIESIATCTKVITTNKDVINYDFFKKENILVLDPSKISIPFDFFTSPSVAVEKPIKYKYSASGFINEIFDYIENQL